MHQQNPPSAYSGTVAYLRVPRVCRRSPKYTFLTRILRPALPCARTDHAQIMNNFERPSSCYNDHPLSSAGTTGYQVQKQTLRILTEGTRDRDTRAGYRRVPTGYFADARASRSMLKVSKVRSATRMEGKRDRVLTTMRRGVAREWARLAQNSELRTTLSLVRM